MEEGWEGWREDGKDGGRDGGKRERKREIFFIIVVCQTYMSPTAVSDITSILN